MSSKDDLYAHALSKTLTKVSAPATLGLYSSCQDRIDHLLPRIQVHLEQEAQRLEQRQGGASKPRPVTPSLCGLLALLSRLLFYRPLWAENHWQDNVRFIHVHFSAWHFAGSDLLWAGLVLRLCQAMEGSFGKLPLSLYRTAQYDEKEEEAFRKKMVADGESCWISKKLCCFPLWLLVLSVLVATVTIVVVLAVFGFPEPEVRGGGEGVNGTNAKQVGVAEGVAIAALGVPAAGAAKFALQLGKNLINNQDRNIRKSMDNEQVSSQLGFMNRVREEMWLLTNFVRFMELFERRRIRILLKITDLDRCSPRKIVSVLDAMNILLSDKNSPFISILAINPEVIVQKVNFADNYFCVEDRAYAFLNRIVTLAFTIPPMTDESKSKVFYSLSSQTNMSMEMERRSAVKGSKSSLEESKLERAERTSEFMPLIDKGTAAVEMVEENVENLITSAFNSILCSDGGKIKKYILDDAMSMRRVISSIRVTVTLMKALSPVVPSPENMAAWVVLANYWPCRLSWVLQCIEDDQQRLEIDNTDMGTSERSKTLWEIFSECRVELYMIRQQIEDLLELDGDPEMFERLLKVDFPFTVKDMEMFAPATVNLDHTIRKELGQIRGMSKLKDLGWTRNIVPLPVKTIINMSVEDVCSELAKMNLRGEYAKVVRDNDLNGIALVYGDVDDIKLLFQMSLGEWTTFRLRFCGSNSQRKAGRLTAGLRRNALPPSHPLNPVQASD